MAFLELFEEATALDVIVLDGMRMLLIHKWKFMNRADQPISKTSTGAYTYLLNLEGLCQKQQNNDGYVCGSLVANGKRKRKERKAGDDE